MKILNVVDRYLFNIAKIAILLCMFLISLNAATRYLLNKPIPGIYEFTEMFLMVMIVFLSVGYTWKLRGYIAITILSEKFNKPSKNIVNLFILIAGIVFFGLIGMEGFNSTLDSWTNSHVASGLIPWPMYLSSIWIPLGCLMIVLRMILEIVNGIRLGIANGFKTDLFPIESESEFDQIMNADE